MPHQPQNSSRDRQGGQRSRAGRDDQVRDTRRSSAPRAASTGSTSRTSRTARSSSGRTLVNPEESVEVKSTQRPMTARRSHPATDGRGDAVSLRRDSVNAEMRPRPASARRSSRNEVYVGGTTIFDRIAPFWPLIAIVVGIIVAIIIVTQVIRCTSDASEVTVAVNEETADVADAEQVQQEKVDAQSDRTVRALTSADLDRFSSTAELSTFALLQNDTTASWVPTLSDTQQALLQTPISRLLKNKKLSFVFLDFSTGCGITYNADQAIYGASSVKASFAAYLCQNYLDTENPVETTVPVDEEYVRGLMEQLIWYSDNDAFYELHTLFDPDGYTKWMKSLGIDDITYSEDNDYATFCSRSLAKVWLNINAYIQTDSETAEWFATLLTNTNRSEIRDALSSQSDVTVWNKAGWLDDPDASYDCTVDAGIISADGHRYLLAVMSSGPDSADSSTAVKNFIKMLFDCRDALS